jgi:hypothetical protein
MDPLQELWDLMEELPLQEPSPTMGTPGGDSIEHPIIQQRKQVDALRLQGMTPDEAHQQVNGEVDLSDTEGKAALAATFGRVQDDGGKKGVKIETDVGFPSILAQDSVMSDTLGQTSVHDLRTPMNKEVPDALQSPDSGLQQQEEMDYNWDVAYLQKYGRA